MSATAAWQMTNPERQTDGMKQEMAEFQTPVDDGWNAGFSTVDHQCALPSKDEDSESTNDCQRVLQHEDTGGRHTDASSAGPDQCAGMELEVSTEEKGC